MSGEAVGAVVVVPAAAIAIPVAAIGLAVATGGAVIYGCAQVVNAVIEHERRIREEQRKEIEEQASKYRNQAIQALNREVSEIKKQKAESQRLQEETSRAKEKKKKLSQDDVDKMKMHDAISVTQLEAKRQEPMGRILKILDSIKELKNNKLQSALRKSAEDLKLDILTSKNDEIDQIIVCLNTFAERFECAKKYGYDSEEKKQLILEMIDFIESEIAFLPKSHSRFVKDDVQAIQSSVIGIKDKIQKDYRYYEDLVKGIKVRTIETVAAAKKSWAEHIQLIETIEKEMIELFIELESIISSPLIIDKAKAINLRETLESLYKLEPKDVNAELKSLSLVIQELYNEYLKLKTLEEERQYIINSVQEVLTEMGYKASEITSQSAVTSDAYRFVEFEIPGGEAVKVGINRDKEFFAAVFHPEVSGSLDTDRFRQQESFHCENLAKLNQGLEKKGLTCKITTEMKISEEKIMSLKDKLRKKANELEQRPLGGDIELEMEI
jgi:hypothetical protein